MVHIDPRRPALCPMNGNGTNEDGVVCVCAEKRHGLKKKNFRTNGTQKMFRNSISPNDSAYLTDWCIRHSKSLKMGSSSKILFELRKLELCKFEHCGRECYSTAGKSEGNIEQSILHTYRTHLCQSVVALFNRFNATRCRRRLWCRFQYISHFQWLYVHLFYFLAMETAQIAPWQCDMRSRTTKCIRLVSFGPFDCQIAYICLVYLLIEWVHSGDLYEGKLYGVQMGGR